VPLPGGGERERHLAAQAEKRLAGVWARGGAKDPTCHTSTKGVGAKQTNPGRRRPGHPRGSGQKAKASDELRPACRRGKRAAGRGIDASKATGLPQPSGNRGAGERAATATNAARAVTANSAAGEGDTRAKGTQTGAAGTGGDTTPQRQQQSESGPGRKKRRQRGAEGVR